MTGVMSMFFDSDLINIGGYEFKRVDNYYNVIKENAYYTPRSDSNGNHFPSRYGTHIKTAEVRWTKNENEPESLFYPDTKNTGLTDILLLNNLVGREQAVIEGAETRRWHVTHASYDYTWYVTSEKESIINQSLNHIKTIQNPKGLKALTWLMESWNTPPFLDTRLFVLRISFEYLYRNLGSQLDDFMNRLKDYIDSFQGVQVQPWWHPSKYLVISRQARNYISHNGELTPISLNHKSQSL